MAAHETFPEIREAVRKLCAGFPGEYWRAKDRDRPFRDSRGGSRQTPRGPRERRPFGGDDHGRGAGTAELADEDADGGADPQCRED